ncbi:hypothetical protein [Fodinicola acaciae]|uniref:hypothetical protein n=1 Tax=Fodinicola acaciae TaxID=2681555 RepID=UPI0013D778D7|nr:hypothetical protein [Fodinicola acaciae]
MITSAGPAVQREIARSLAALVLERYPVERGQQALDAIIAERFDDAELRTWLEDTGSAHATYAQRLHDRRDAALDAGQAWPEEQERKADELEATGAVMQTLAAALDPVPNIAAQDAAYIARVATSDREADTVVGFVLDKAGYDVSQIVYWLHTRPTP